MTDGSREIQEWRRLPGRATERAVAPLTELGARDAGGRTGDHASRPCNGSERLPWTQRESVTSWSLAEGRGCDMRARPT